MSESSSFSLGNLLSRDCTLGRIEEPGLRDVKTIDVFEQDCFFGGTLFLESSLTHVDLLRDFVRRKGGGVENGPLRCPCSRLSAKHAVNG